MNAVRTQGDDAFVVEEDLADRAILGGMRLERGMQLEFRRVERSDSTLNPSAKVLRNRAP